MFQKIKKNSLNYSLKLIKISWKKQRKNLILMTSLLLFKIILPFVILLTLQRFFNMLQDGNYTNIWRLFILYGTAIITNDLVDTFYQYVQGKFKIEINYHINCMILDKANELTLSEYEDSETYNRLIRALEETNAPYHVISDLYIIANKSINVIINILILITLNWLIIPIILIFPIVSLFFTIKIGKYEYDVIFQRTTNTRRLKYFSQLLSDNTSFKEKKSYNITDYIYKKYKNIFLSFVEKDKEIMAYKSKNYFVFKFLEVFIALICMTFVVSSAILGKIMVGTANTFISCIWNTISSSDAVITSLARVYTKSQYLRNLFEFLSNGNNNSEKNNNNITEMKTIQSIDSIEFKNVSFRYKENLPYALKNINLKIQKGESIAILGETGSGKSTFIKLLSNLYDNYEGNIFINGIDLKELNPINYFEQISVMYQDFLKFELSFKEALKLGNLSLKDEEIESFYKKISKTGFLSFDKKNDNILDLQLGSKFDGGVQVSGGEWQKIAFLRSIISDCKVLVLDEPSSNLDIFSEDIMFNIMDEFSRDRILLLITHRMYNITNHVKKVIIFESGEIIENDSIDNLLGYESRLKEMYDKAST